MLNPAAMVDAIIGILQSIPDLAAAPATSPVQTPDLKKAPGPPYLRDFSRAPVSMFVGLADDELGYIVPRYDFKTRSNALMLPRMPGHYEETNSIGPSATDIILKAERDLLLRRRIRRFPKTPRR